MALIIGDSVVIKEGSAAVTMCTSLNQLIFVTADNIEHLQSLVDAGLAQPIISPAKRYIALVTQSGSNNPTAIVLRNTLSDAPTWARSAEGIYTVTLTGEFTANKTFSRAKVVALKTGNEFQGDLDRTSANVLTLKVYDFGGSLVDGFAATVEIEVYA